MRTKTGDIVTWTDPHRYKFADAISELIYDDTMRWADRSSGDAESPVGWFATAGRYRIIRGDERGFVWTERFRTETQRDMVYIALDSAFGAWCAEEWDDEWVDEDTQQAQLAERLLYLAHLYRLEGLGADLPTFDEWKETT